MNKNVEDASNWTKYNPKKLLNTKTALAIYALCGFTPTAAVLAPLIIVSASFTAIKIPICNSFKQILENGLTKDAAYNSLLDTKDQYANIACKIFHMFESHDEQTSLVAEENIDKF